MTWLDAYIPGPVITRTSDYTVPACNGQVVEVGALSRNISITLPASPVVGQLVIVKSRDPNAYTISVVGNGKLIDGAASVSLSEQYASESLVYVGSEWSRVGGAGGPTTVAPSPRFSPVDIGAEHNGAGWSGRYTFGVKVYVSSFYNGGASAGALPTFTGVRFYAGMMFDGSRPIRCSLYDADGTELATVTETVEEQGIVCALFDTPYVIPACGTYYLAICDQSESGARYCGFDDTADIPPEYGGETLGPGVTLLEYCYASGANCPDTDALLPGCGGFAVEPIFEE